MSAQREPEQIYARARDEGRRRLARPVVELVATALVGGFDVALGRHAAREPCSAARRWRSS